VLTKVLDLMITNKDLEEEVGTKYMDNPKAVYSSIKKGGLKTDDKKGKKLKEEFSHYTSVGIERILKNNNMSWTPKGDIVATQRAVTTSYNGSSESSSDRSGSSPSAVESEKKTSEEEADKKKTSEEEADKKKTSEEEADKKKTSEEEADKKKTSEEEADKKKTSEEEADKKKTSEEEADKKKTSEEGAANSTEYKELYQPMASESEMASFNTYADHFVGEPRKIKRILNSFMLSRTIAKRLSPSVTMNSSFSGKLLKLIILCEQWPYRMAWLFVVVDNFHKEGIMNGETNDSVVSVFSIIKEIPDDSEEIGKSGDGLNIPLFKIYRLIVKVLIHSPDDAKIQLQRDGDPYLFDMLLSDGKDSSELKIKDVAAFSDEKFNEDTVNEDTVRPFIFNLQRHLIEKAQVQIDNCVLYFDSEDNTLKYQMKSEKFCVKNKSPPNDFPQPHDTTNP